MDNFKKYLEEHRDEMGPDQPSDILWQRIEKNLITKKRSARLIIIRSLGAAAAVAILVFTGLHLWDKTGSIIPPGTAVNSVPAEVPGPIDTTRKILPETEPQIARSVPKKQTVKKRDVRYKMMESFKENYSQLVNYQLNSIRSTPVFAEDPSYFNDFKIRLQQMDKDEKNIRKTIHQQGMSNALLDQLINLYQQKIDVLKSLQSEINKMNERVKEKVPADSSHIFYLNI